MRAAVLLLAAAVLGCGEDKPEATTPYLPDGYITGLYPVDRHRAIVVVDGRQVIAVDDGGALRWWRTLPVEISLFDGVQVAEEVVTVRGVANGEETVAAFALAGGRPLWSTSLGPVDDSYVPVDQAFISLAVPGRVLEPRNDGTLIVLDRRDGRAIARWQAGYGAAVQQPIAVAPDTVVQVSNGGLLVHRLDAGSSAQVGDLGLGHGCVRDGHYFAVSSSDTRAELVSIDLGTLVRTGWTSLGAPFYAHGCGTRAGHIVFVGMGRAGVEIVKVDASTGVMVSRQLLAGEEYRAVGVAEWDADRGLFSGALARHVAFLNEDDELLVVDVDTGAVAQRLVFDSDEVRHTFRVGGRFVALGWHGEIRAIDLETGELTEHAAPAFGVELRPHHVVDDHYWTARGRWPGVWSVAPL